MKKIATLVAGAAVAAIAFTSPAQAEFVLADNVFADLGATGFPGQEDAVSKTAQPIGETLDLRGFTAAFAAFERDENAAPHENGAECAKPRCRCPAGARPALKLVYLDRGKVRAGRLGPRLRNGIHNPIRAATGYLDEIVVLAMRGPRSRRHVLEIDKLPVSDIGPAKAEIVAHGW